MLTSLTATLCYIALSWKASIAYLTPFVLVPFLALDNRFRVKIDHYTRGRILFIFYVLLIFSIIHFIFGCEKVGIVKGVLRYFGYLLLLVVVLNVPHRFLKIYWRSVLLMLTAAIPFYKKFLHFDIELSEFRYAFIFEHPNHLAYSILPIVALCLINESNKWRCLSLAVGFGSILMTGSSGGLISLAALVFLYYLGDTRQAIIVAFLLVALFLLGKSFGVFDKIVEQFNSFLLTDIITRTESENFGGAGSLSWRVIYWSTILLAFFSANLTQIMFGLGSGSMSFGSYFYQFMYTDPHNDFIRVMVEFGVIGLALFIAFIYLLIKSMAQYKMMIAVLIIFPMFFGNVIVNPSYVLGMVFLVVTIKKYKQKNYV